MEGRVVEFEVQTPISGTALFDRVVNTLALDYPDLEPGTPKRGPLVIVANGPSARDADLFTHDTLSLNGSLRLFGEKRAAPTYWAACDPQRIVGNFLGYVPPETIYLVSSKCHRAVFSALMDRDVRVWHLAEEEAIPALTGRTAILPAVSITLCAIDLARYLGYPSVRIYGWDGRYIDGQDHAVSQPHNREHDIELDVGGRIFQTTTTWAVEAQEAHHILSASDYPVEIMGDGMIRALLAHLRSGADQAA